MCLIAGKSTTTTTVKTTTVKPVETKLRGKCLNYYMYSQVFLYMTDLASTKNILKASWS